MHCEDSLCSLIEHLIVYMRVLVENRDCAPLRLRGVTVFKSRQEERDWGAPADGFRRSHHICCEAMAATQW